MSENLKGIGITYTQFGRNGHEKYFAGPACRLQDGSTPPNARPSDASLLREMADEIDKIEKHGGKITWIYTE